MGIMGSCGRIYLEQALSANSWLISQPNCESSLLQCPVGCEDVLLTFSSLKALMNHSHLPLAHGNQQHLLWDNVFKSKGHFF